MNLYLIRHVPRELYNVATHIELSVDGETEYSDAANVVITRFILIS